MQATYFKDLFIEKTRSRLYLNFISFCSLSYKQAVMRTLFNRAQKLYSDKKVGEELSTVEVHQ